VTESEKSALRACADFYATGMPSCFLCFLSLKCFSPPPGIDLLGFCLLSMRFVERDPPSFRFSPQPCSLHNGFFLNVLSPLAFRFLDGPWWLYVSLSQTGPGAHTSSFPFYLNPFYSFPQVTSSFSNAMLRFDYIQSISFHYLPFGLLIFYPISWIKPLALSYIEGTFRLSKFAFTFPPPRFGAIWSGFS